MSFKTGYKKVFSVEQKEDGHFVTIDGTSKYVNVAAILFSLFCIAWSLLCLAGHWGPQGRFSNSLDATLVFMHACFIGIHVWRLSR